MNRLGPMIVCVRRKAKLGGASLRSRVGSLLVALSLLVQIAVAPYHQALAAPGLAGTEANRVTAELKATFGDAAALCVDVDGKGAPLHPAGHCDDQCPLCRFVAQAGAWVEPNPPALPLQHGAACDTLGAASQQTVCLFRLESQNLARAPPLSV